MSEGTAWPSVVNLANSIVGVSVLAMPYCFKELGVVLGPLLLLLSSYFTRKSCHFLVKAGAVAKRRSYEFLALHAFGPVGKLGVELCTIGLMLATCVGFFVIIGDLAPPIVSKILAIPNVSSLRASILVLTAFGVALPLGLLRKLSSLTSVSSLSFGFYFALVVFLFFQALPSLFSDKWSKGPHQLSYWRPAGILKCFPIFGLAFACQTQLFPIYDNMAEPSLKRMLNVIDSAINVVAAIYLSVGFFGIVAFHDGDVVGDILLSFRPSIMGEAIKLGFVVSVAVSFPLVIFPCRLSINSLLWPLPKKGMAESLGGDGVEGAGAGYIPPLRFKGITLGIVVTTLIIGIQVPGIESILGLVGSTVGVIISFIFPSLTFLYVVTISHGTSREKFISKIVLAVGLFIMLSSTYMNLTETKIKPLPIALTPITPNRVVDNFVPKKRSADKPPVAPVASVAPAVVVGDQEVRREPPVPDAPVEVVVPVIKKEEEKRIVEVKLEPVVPAAMDKNVNNDKKPAAAAAVVVDKDYDNLQKKLDAAEEKHDVLLKQLEKQQEQQQIIMEQQNQIIEQLKVKDYGAGGAAAGGAMKPESEAAGAAAPAAVVKELEKTKREIDDANKILNRVAEEAKRVETIKAAKKAAEEAAAAAAEDKKNKEAELSKKVEEAAKFMAEDEEKKKVAAAVAEEAKKKKMSGEEEEAAKKKKAEEDAAYAKRVEEAARYIAEQEAAKKKKKLAEEEEAEKKKKRKAAEEEAAAAAAAKSAKMIADAKRAAAEAKKKEEEAHEAAQLAVLKVLEAKKAASDAEVKNAALKDVASVAPEAPPAKKKAAALEDAAPVEGKANGAVVVAPEAMEGQGAKPDVKTEDVVEAVPDTGPVVDGKNKNPGDAADAAPPEAAAARSNNKGPEGEKEALKKKVEKHEKLIVQMHQKIQEVEKEKESVVMAAAAAAVVVGAQNEVPDVNGNGNPKPLGLLKATNVEPAVAAVAAPAKVVEEVVASQLEKPAAAAAEEAKVEIKPVVGKKEEARVPGGGVKTEVGVDEDL